MQKGHMGRLRDFSFAIGLIRNRQVSSQISYYADGLQAYVREAVLRASPGTVMLPAGTPMEVNAAVRQRTFQGTCFAAVRE